MQKMVESLAFLIKAKKSDESSTTSGARTHLAILMGWGLAGGFDGLLLHTALPPSRWQRDHVFVKRKIEAFMDYLKVDMKLLGEKGLQRNVKYVRDTMSRILLQRADQEERFGKGREKKNLDTHFLNRGNHTIVRSLFVSLTGAWIHCPFCFEPFFSQSAIGVHLPKCLAKLPTEEEKKKFLDKAQNYSNYDGDMYHCVLCNHSSSTGPGMKNHLADGTHSRRQLLLMGFSRYFLDEVEHEAAIAGVLMENWSHFKY